MIDGELEPGRKILRMGDDEEIEAGGKFGRGRFDRDDFERVVPFRRDVLAGLGLLAHHHHHLRLLGIGALERQAGQQAHLGLVEVLHAIDQLGQIVFEKLFPLRHEGGDGLLLVGLGDDEPKEELFAALLRHLGRQACGRGPFLLRRVGAGIDDLE